MLFLFDPAGWAAFWPLYLTAFFGAYLSGSVPFGLIVTRLGGLGDIRKIGSGNIGATNVLRTGSKKLAAATLLLDALKGAVPVLFAKLANPEAAELAALGAVLGHMFPVWLKFKGGKAVATTIGVFFGLSWPMGLSFCAVWLGMALVYRISSLSALTAAALLPVYAIIWHGGDHIGVALIVAALVWARHHENIRRLGAGEEPEISFKGKKA